jgi:hypothetical protein
MLFLRVGDTKGANEPNLFPYTFACVCENPHAIVARTSNPLGRDSINRLGAGKQRPQDDKRAN